jgi:hypothetical protein
MTVVLYDNLAYNADILLDLPFREGTGTITQDIAKPHHVMTMVDPGAGSFVWGNEASGIPTLEWVRVGSGVTDGVYIECATCADLDFTTEDYTLMDWIKYTDTSSSISLFNRGLPYETGWEFYIWSNILQLRHNHAGGATTSTGANYTGIASYIDTWTLVGVSRSGADAQIYINGLPVTTVVSDGGLIDPETSARDLVIGSRTTKTSDWYDGKMERVRIWGRALSATDWMNIYQVEKVWFA